MNGLRRVIARLPRWMRGEVDARVPVAVLVFSAFGLVAVANREAYVAKPYQDQAGVWTNGYGNTNNVDPTKSVTPQRALLDLLNNANTAADGVRRCVTAKLFQYEFDAYVELAFNIGVGAFCRSSGNPAKPNLIDLINAQRYAEACDRILAFNKFRNPKTGLLEASKGLSNARERERRRCLGEQVL